MLGITNMLVVFLTLLVGVSSLTVLPACTNCTIDVEGAVSQGHKCGTWKGHVPDIPARVFQTRIGVQMIVGSTAYFPMAGPSPLNQTRSCTISYNKSADGDPSHYAADEYLDSPVVFPNGTVVALVHTEFPGNKFNNSGGPGEPYCTGSAYPNCWTVSIGLVVSNDFGATFRHPLSPPHHLVAAVPYMYNQSQLASGWGDPSNILKHPSDGYYYAAIWNRHQVGLQAPGICMMRTNALLDPGSWRAWDGQQYSVRFADAYTMEPGTDVSHICTVTNLPAGSVDDGCAAHGLFWSAYLNQFVATLGCNQAQQAVFKYATSDDLITWSNAEVLLSPEQARHASPDVRRGMNYPTFIDPTAPTAFGDPNYGTIGQYPYLFWVSIGDNPEDIGRHLLATPFRIQK